MRTQIKILGALFLGIALLLAVFSIIGLLAGRRNAGTVVPILLVFICWFGATGWGLCRLDGRYWLHGLIIAGIFLLMLNSIFLFGDSGKFAISTGQTVFHLSCVALGIYSLVILLLPKGKAVLFPERARQLAQSSVAEEVSVEGQEQIELGTKPRIVFREKMPLKSKLYLAGVVVFVAALAGLMSLGAGTTVGLLVIGIVVSITLALVFVGAYVSFTGMQIVCGENGFQVDEIGGQRRRILAVRRGSIVLFVVSLVVLVIFMNFFNKPGPPSMSVLLLVLGCCFGIILGIAGFLLGQNIDLTLGKAGGRKRFGWQQVTDTQILQIDDKGNFTFVVRVDGEEVINYASGAQGFRNLLRVFNENASHLPFLWVDQETVHRREVIENVNGSFFKVSRQ